MSIPLLDMLANGDVEGFLKLEAEADPVLVSNVKKSMEHMYDVGLYKQAYGYGNPAVDELPPEVLDRKLQVGARQHIVLEFVANHKGRRQLDIASSNGILLLRAKLLGIIDYGLGVELNSSRVTVSNSAKEYLGVSDVKFINGMFEETHLEEKFDIITAGEVLEHVIDPVVFLKKAVSHLSPEGIIITTVPVGRPPLAPDEYGSVVSNIPREHVRFLSREVLLGVAREAGLYEKTYVTEGSAWVNLISVWAVSP